MLARSNKRMRNEDLQKVMFMKIADTLYLSGLSLPWGIDGVSWRDNTGLGHGKNRGIDF